MDPEFNRQLRIAVDRHQQVERRGSLGKGGNVLLQGPECAG